MAEDWNGREYTRINTWKRIATYLGEDPEIVKTWAVTNGLPIHRWPDGERGGVFAYSVDLDRWMRNELVKADARQEGAGDRADAAELPETGGRGTEDLPGDAARIGGVPDAGGLAGGVLVGTAAQHGDAVSGPSTPESLSPPKMVTHPGTRGFLFGAAAMFVAVLMMVLLHSLQSVSLERLPQAKRSTMGVLREVAFKPLKSLREAGRTQIVHSASRQDVAGSVTGNVTGNVTGGVAGNVTGNVAGSVNGSVNGDEAGDEAVNAVGPHKPDAAAEELYLRGRYAWSLRTPQSLELARQLFSDAIVRDPQYARAHAGLADCYLLLRQYGQMSAAEAFPKAEEAAQEALALDKESPEAHRSMAFVLSYWSWDMAAAEREFRRALELNPNDAETHHWYATSLMNRGRFKEALAQIDQARSLDPSSSAIVANRGLILLLAGEHEAGAAALEGLEATNPKLLMPHLYMADEDLRCGEDAAFLREEETVARMMGDRRLADETRAARRSLRSGGHAAMLQTLARVSAAYADDGGDAYQAAFYGMMSKDRENTLRYLKMSHDRHDPNFLSIDDNSAFAPLRSDPQFRALVAMTDVHA